MNAVRTGVLSPFRTASQCPGQALARLLLILALVSPVLLFLAYPSVFILGSAALVLLPATWRAGQAALWRRYGLFVAVVGGSCAILLFGPVRAVQTNGLLSWWKDFFPPWDRPWLVPGQLGIRLLEALRYAQEPIGHTLAVFAMAGGVVLWRTGQRRLLAFLLVPMALNALAWLLGRYPLAATRVCVYLAPALLILVAAGIPPVMNWLWQRSRAAALSVALVLLLPPGLAVLRLLDPWKRLDSASPAAYVLRHRQPHEPVLADLWEQAYYFRRLGPWHQMRRPVWPEALRSFWFLGNHRDHGPDLLPEFTSSREWQVAERIRYDGITLLHMRRVTDAGEECEE